MRFEPSLNFEIRRALATPRPRGVRSRVWAKLLPVGALMAMAIAPAAHAEKPTAEEVKKVINYFETGAGQGPILLEMTPCLKIGKKEGEKRKSCVEPAGETVARKTTLNIWTSWMVPKDDKYDDIRVVFLHEGEVRATKDLKVSPGFNFRYGTWTAKGLFKTGNWEIKIKRGDVVLQSAKITVE